MVDAPASDEAEIWSSIRTGIGGLAVLDLVAMVLISEALEDLEWRGLSLSVWAIVIGVPVFLLLSALTLFGDRMLGMRVD